MKSQIMMEFSIQEQRQTNVFKEHKSILKRSIQSILSSSPNKVPNAVLRYSPSTPHAEESQQKEKIVINAIAINK
jgi:hypothetical protein